MAWLLDAGMRAGLRRVILATGYRSGQIEQVVGHRWGDIEIAYSREDEPLGTGGAIGLALGQVRGDGVHLANGDTFLRYQPSAPEAATRASGCVMGIALARVEDVGRYGAVEITGGKVTGFSEKGGSGPGLINAGSYYLAREAFDRLPREAAWSFEERLLRPWSERGEVAAFEATSDFIDIGVPEDYARAQAMFAATGA